MSNGVTKVSSLPNNITIQFNMVTITKTLFYFCRIPIK